MASWQVYYSGLVLLDLLKVLTSSLLLLGFILVGGTGDGPLASIAADAACATGAGAAGAWTALVLVKSFAFLGMCV